MGIRLSDAQKAKLKIITDRWLKEASQNHIVLMDGVQVEMIDGKPFAVAKPNNAPLQRWKEPLD